MDPPVEPAGTLLQAWSSLCPCPLVLCLRETNLAASWRKVELLGGAAARPQPVSQRCLSTRGGRHRADAAAPRGTVLWLGGTQASDLWPFPGTSGNRSSGAGAGAWRGTRGPGRGGAGQGASRRSDGGTETALRLPGPGLAQAPDRLAHAARHPHGRTQDVEGRRTREQGPEA